MGYYCSSPQCQRHRRISRTCWLISSLFRYHSLFSLYYSREHLWICHLHHAFFEKLKAKNYFFPFLYAYCNMQGSLFSFHCRKAFVLMLTWFECFVGSHVSTLDLEQLALLASAFSLRTELCMTFLGPSIGTLPLWSPFSIKKIYRLYFITALVKYSFYILLYLFFFWFQKKWKHFLKTLKSIMGPQHCAISA